MVAGLLPGVRVLDVGQGISAPYCAKILAQMGAEVIKVEPPDGDEARRMGPFPGDSPHPERSGLFLAMNSNKYGVSLDLASPDGAEAFKRLAAGADIVYLQTPMMEAHGGEGVLNFFRYIADRTDIALGMFNSPSSGYVLTAAESARIATDRDEVKQIIPRENLRTGHGGQPINHSGPNPATLKDNKTTAQKRATTSKKIPLVMSQQK